MADERPAAAAEQLPDLEDTLQQRQALEDWAVPRCEAWREQHPDPCAFCNHHAEHHGALEAADIDGCALCDCRAAYESFPPAPYCCSAYCLRCAGLRSLDQQRQIYPNEWIFGDE